MHKNVVRIFLSLVTVLIFGLSCAGTAFEPKDENEILAVGLLRFEGQNFPNFNGATVNGEHTSGIDLTIEDLSTGKRVVLLSGTNGVFYFRPNPETSYRLAVLNYESKVGNNNAIVRGTPGAVVFRIGSDRVSSLGTITWKADDKAKYYADIFVNGERSIKEVVTQSFPQSKWYQYDWVQVRWSFN